MVYAACVYDAAEILWILWRTNQPTNKAILGVGRTSGVSSRVAIKKHWAESVGMVYWQKCYVEYLEHNAILQFKESRVHTIGFLQLLVGKLGILLSRRAERPFCSSTDALVSRWLIVSPSSWPVCLARADPSFLNCSSPTLCQPPRDSATTGMKAIPCWSHWSAAPLNLLL